jgi:hypothetical protein
MAMHARAILGWKTERLTGRGADVDEMVYRLDESDLTKKF